MNKKRKIVLASEAFPITPVNEFIDYHIRLSNRRLMIVNGLIILAVIFILFLTGKDICNLLFGPRKITLEEMKSMSPNVETFWYYFEVKADTVLSTGFELVEYPVTTQSVMIIDLEQKLKETGVKTASNSGTVVGRFDAILNNDRVLLCLVRPTDTGQIYTGMLVPVPFSLRRDIQADSSLNDMMTRGIILPFVLDSRRGPDIIVYFEIVLLLPILAVGTFNLWRAFKRKADPSIHPIWRSLKIFGDPAQFAASIDTELIHLGPSAKRSGTFLTNSWLLSSSFLGLRLAYLPDAVWAYEKQTKHYHNMVPTGKTFAILIHDRHGRKVEFPTVQEGALMILRKLQSVYPWLIVGWNSKIADLWNQSPVTLTALVDERKNKLS